MLKVRKWLVDLRTKKGESQSDAARGMGITRQNYYQIERGERQKVMDMDVMLRISTHFGISLDQIAKLENATVNA